jgi:DNA-binding LacI/PurR family transcriptional regulator
MITAKEVAELADVSISTVGRALSDDPRISGDTKAKVKRAAERIGYVGNMPARVMRGGTSNLIGLLLPDVRNDFYAAIAQALSQTCDQEGHRLVLSITGDDREIEARHVRELAGARAAGIIIVPTAQPRKETVKVLLSLPHVQFLRQVPSLGNAWFGIDDERALRDATAHLLGLGHRRIAYIGGSDSLSTGASRVQGFRRAFADAGIDASHAIEALGKPTLEYGADAIEVMMRLDRPPTAIVTGSVHITMGIIETAERQGIEIPQQLSMIGFGDPQWFSWWRGGLTTVRPPVQELATTCGLWFLNRLKSRNAAEAPMQHSTISNSSLVLRSTAVAHMG